MIYIKIFLQNLISDIFKLKNTEIFFMALVAWLLINPYQGIWHDARIYLITAYQYSIPEAYLRDSWFSHGSQSDFSLFAFLYGILLNIFGVEKGAFFTSFLGGVTGVLGIFYLSRIWLSEKIIFPLLVLSTFPLYYSYTASNVIEILESFATARPFSLGFGLIGLAAYLKCRYLISIIFITLSILLHPLLGIWILLAIIACNLNDRWLVSLLSVICTVFISLTIFTQNIPSLQNMPYLWRELVRETSVIVLAKDTTDLSLDRNLGWIALLLWGYRLSCSNYSRWYAIIALLASWALFLIIITSFYYTIPLVAQVQPWRVQWLAITVAVLAGFDLLYQQNLSTLEKISRIIFLLSPLAAGTGVGFLLFLAWLIWSIEKTKWSFILMKDKLSKNFQLRLMQAILFGLIIIAILIQFNPENITDLQSINGVDEDNMEVSSVTRWLILICAIFISTLWKKRWLVHLVIVFFIFLSLYIWDQRSALAKAREESYTMQGVHTLNTAGIKQGDVVYWPNNDALVWFVLTTANYFGNLQAIGIVFSEKNATVLYQRAKTISDIMPQKSIWDDYSPLNLHNNIYHDVDPGPTEVKKLCRDPDLDHVISWQHPLDPNIATQFGMANNKFWAYHCRYLR